MLGMLWAVQRPFAACHTEARHHITADKATALVFHVHHSVLGMLPAVQGRLAALYAERSHLAATLAATVLPG